ncbi:MAG: hypothetical protein HC851_08620 [Acaryochloris sp. RU_4_1]|nr:hypothetical protein [Acaryochloris sp. RU_4_1]
MSSSTGESQGSRPINLTIESPFPTTRTLLSSEEYEFEEEHKPYSRPYSIESPFRSVYELEDAEGAVDPEAEEAMEFLDELYDEEFDEALFELVSEASELYEDRFESEYGDPLVQKMQAMQLLEQHFAPLVQETEALIDALAEEVKQLNSSSLGESELEVFIDRYKSQTPLPPSFEKFLGGLAKKAANLAKKGIQAVGKLGFDTILKKLKVLINPLLKKVLGMAINKLPVALRPIAEQLAKRWLKQEVEAEDVPEGEDATPDISGVQREFDGAIANLLFAREDVEREVTISEYVRASQQPLTHDPLSDLDRARIQFVQRLGELREGEDPTPLVENFIPALLPVMKAGITIAGRSKIVNYLAKLLAKLVQKFVGPQYAPALSQAIVDVGLRLINLEATPEDESMAARSAIAATVEDTVRQVAALPEYILDKQELLEGFVLEAFEQAAAVNLPPVLPERVYETRPELRETNGMRAVWVLQPLRSKKKHYKKCTRVYDILITPHMARTIKTFCDIPLAEFLQDRLGLLSGRPVKARVHLYEAIPGTLLSQVCKSETYVPGLGSISAWTNLHPLTPEAAGMIMGQPGLGREVPPKYLDHQPITAVGQRLYYLEIPEARSQAVPTPEGAPKPRRIRQVHVRLNFPGDQIQVNVFLSEAVAQAIAADLRGRAIAKAISRVRSVFEARLKTILSGKHQSHLKIIHGKVSPQASRGRKLRSLPSIMRETLSQKLIEWIGQNLSNYLQQKPQDFIAATENPADGVTLKLTFRNPPGFAALRKALRGEVTNLQDMQTATGMPDVNIQVTPGFSRD